MADYSALKATIDASINTNGQQAITGAILNSVLNEMVDVLGEGYQFMGIATPSTNPGTPDENVFYLASTAGTYPNFGNITINENCLGLLLWDGTSWTKEEIEGLGGGGVSGGLVAVVEEGFYIVDENLNIGAYLDNEGWHAINVLEYTIVNR